MPFTYIYFTTMEENKQPGQIRKSRTTERFSIIPNAILQRPDLSWKAKGLFAYLKSLPEDWVIYKTELHRHATDGHDSTAVAFNELMKLGYIEKIELRSPKGHFKGYDYIMYDSPIREFPKSENPESENPESENPVPDKPQTGNPKPENPQLQKKHSTKKPLSKVPKEEKPDPTKLYLAGNICYGYEPDNKEHLREVVESERIFLFQSLNRPKLAITRKKFEEFLMTEHNQHSYALQRFSIPAKEILDEFFKKGNLNTYDDIGHIWNVIKKVNERLLEKKSFTGYTAPGVPLQVANTIIEKQGVTASEAEKQAIERENARLLSQLRGEN